jgi:hypothetical protein
MSETPRWRIRWLARARPAPPGGLDVGLCALFAATFPDAVTGLVLRATDSMAPPAAGREVAELIPGARFVELPGADAWPFTDEVDAWIEEIEEFLTGERPAPFAGTAGAVGALDVAW